MPTVRHPRGAEIKKAMIDAGMTQRDVASRLGIPVSSFSMKLLGNRKWTEEEKDRVAEILERPKAELFPSEDSEEEQNTQEQNHSDFLPDRAANDH